ncbi:MAG TPA: phosphatase PAP2 family protein [Azoarcus taiwanensis]|nr:phosphatase PAP2 family protein [Azoarcus taiwanensis]
MPNTQPPKLRSDWTWLLLPALIPALLALLVVAGEANTSLFLAWNEASRALPAEFWAGVTNIASTGGAFAVLAVALHWQPRWAASALLALPAGTIYAHGLKKLFQEARPGAVLDPDQIWIVGKLLKANAFPSGHSVTAFGIGAAIALCCLTPGRRWLAWVALAIAALAAFSRVAVGAHWPLDIFAGAAGGWLCGALGVWWSSRWHFWTRPMGIRIMAGIIGVSSLWLFFDDLGYPEGLWMQYLLATAGCAGALYALVRPTPRSAA